MGRRVIRGQHVDRSTPASRQLAMDLDPQPGRKRPPKKKRKHTPGTVFEINRAVSDIERRLKEEDWDKLKPDGLLALFVWCHDQTYGTRPSDLRGETWRRARFQAAAMVKRDFNGDMDAALAFMRWTWQRERRIEQWRRDNNQHGKVINWYDQFVRGELLTKYRVDVARGQTG